MLALALWYVGVLAIVAAAAAAAWWLRGVRDLRQIDAFRDLIMNMPPDVGVSIVSTGDARGDADWQWRGDSVAGRVLRCSPSFDRLIGREVGSVVGMTFAQFTTSDTVGEDLSLFEAVLAGASHGYTMEKAYRSPSGERIPVGLSVIVPSPVAGETPPWVIAVVVSRQRAAERDVEIALLRRQTSERSSLGGMRELLETLR